MKPRDQTEATSLSRLCFICGPFGLFRHRRDDGLTEIENRTQISQMSADFHFYLRNLRHLRPTSDHFPLKSGEPISLTRVNFDVHYCYRGIAFQGVTHLAKLARGRAI
jgi:hypothetical protein